MLITAIGAMACAFFGGNEYLLFSQSTKEPEEISLRELIQRGSDGNPNIILTDYEIFNDYIYRKRLLGRVWQKVWIPIVPSDEDGDETAVDSNPAIHVFLYGEDVEGESGVRERFDRPQFRGMINPMAPTPGIIQSVLINQRYPGTKVENCMIIVEGKEPPGVMILGLFGFGFIAFFGMTAGIWYVAKKLDEVEEEPESADRKQPAASKPGEGAEIDVFLPD